MSFVFLMISLFMTSNLAFAEIPENLKQEIVRGIPKLSEKLEKLEANDPSGKSFNKNDLLDTFVMDQMKKFQLVPDASNLSKMMKQAKAYVREILKNEDDFKTNKEKLNQEIDNNLPKLRKKLKNFSPKAGSVDGKRPVVEKFVDDQIKKLQLAPDDSYLPRLKKEAETFAYMKLCNKFSSEKDLDYDLKSDLDAFIGDHSGARAKEIMGEICSWLEHDHISQFVQASQACKNFIEEPGPDFNTAQFKRKSTQAHVIQSYQEYQNLAKNGYLDLSELILDFSDEKDLQALLKDERVQNEVKSLRIISNINRLYLRGVETYTLFGGLKKLNSLGLSGVLNINTGAEHFAELGKLKNITHLELSNTAGMSLERIMHLAPELGKLTGLTHLDLGSTFIGAEEAKLLAPELGKLTGLTHLDLRHTTLLEKAVEHLAPELGKLTGLTHLDLQDNFFGAEGVQYLIPALTNQKHIRLYLKGNLINNADKKRLQEAFQLMPNIDVEF